MATCRDCIHHEICVLFLQNTDTVCNGFADKSRYIELPCKVGDTLYCICGNEIHPVEIKMIISAKREEAAGDNVCLYDGDSWYDFICQERDIGQYARAWPRHDGAFYTREEAEEALKKSEEERLRMKNLEECCILKDGDEE